MRFLLFYLRTFVFPYFSSPVLRRCHLANLLFFSFALSFQIIMAGQCNKPILEVALEHPGARPLMRDAGHVGYDISACVPFLIPGSGWTEVKTGLKLAIPPDHVGTICSKIGYPATRGLTVQVGIIDPNYQDEIKVL